ncbi:hypothetical protein RRG08_018539 [Elysia crispata]|uniref:SDR family oxidoreductase n=1 Tax=Elysia crispata TaxID=231223 RepID=A0AAE1CWW3_9GAST|nr:hypothetical protein RRG08_018539 [Elysia crispata]
MLPSGTNCIAPWSCGSSSDAKSHRPLGSQRSTYPEKPLSHEASQISRLALECATPEEFGHAVLFLASDESRYITGHTVVVDAGVTLVGAFSGPN